MDDSVPATANPIQLPVFDISQITHESGKAMIDAAIEYGFFYVDSKSSDFKNDDVEGAFSIAREFFARPYEEKADFKIKTDNSGWVGMHREILDPENQQRGDFKEAMNFREFKNGRAQQPLPPSISPHEAEVARFLDLCQKTCHRILSLLALGLETPADWFTSRHDTSKGPTGNTFRYLYYPSLRRSSTSSYNHTVDLRAGAHSDYGSITLLFQRDGQPGLEILTPAGEWAPVPVRPQSQGSSGDAGSQDTFPPILVNIADLLSYWTSGLLKSTIHRVVFPNEEREEEKGEAQDRYSMAFFCHPLHTAELVPVPSKLVEQHRRERKSTNDPAAAGADEPGTGPRGEKALTAEEHLAGRLAATYGGDIKDYKRE